MIRFFIVLVVWLLYLSDGFSQVVTTEFQRTFGGLKKENSYAVIPTSDNGVFSLGTTESYGAGKSDIYLIKTDSMGNLEWAKSYGGTNDDYGTFIDKGKDGNYVIVGYTYSYSKDYNDICLIKINEKGEVIWSKMYGLDKSDYSTAVQCTSDGGFIILGETINTIGNDKNSDILVIKVSKDGAIEWSRVFGGSNTEYGYSIQEVKTGGYIIGGETNSYGSGDWDFYLLKLSNSGELEWSKTYGDSNIDYGRYAQPCPDGGFIIGGNSASFEAQGFDFLIVKTDKEGNVEWSKQYGGIGTDYLLSMKAVNDKGFVFTGYSNSERSQSEDMVLAYIDFRGKPIFVRLYGSDQNDYGVTINCTNDKKDIIIGGSTNGFGTRSDDVILIKTPLKSRSYPCNLNFFYPFIAKKVNVKSKSGHYQYDIHCMTSDIEVTVGTTLTAEQIICTPNLIDE